MGTPTPDLESAHDHELVTDDELLVEEASLPLASDASAPSRGLRVHEDAPSRVLVRVGEILAGKYRVERVHAPGPLGVSCDAEHLQLRQRVLVKLCPSSRTGSEGSSRFLESARLAAQLRNSHLARVLDVGRLDSGIAYAVTEHLSGTDLRGVLRVREWLPVSEAVDYAIQVCEALAVAHVAGFVHRNLKPTNVFFAREGDGRPIIKVLDFCLVDGACTDTSVVMSSAESAVNSLAYLAPEQVRDPSSVDVRADIWAIGALLHESLTGSPLYSASSVPGIFAAIAADDATPITQLRSELPRELEEIVLRCLEKERDYRWSDVGTLAKQLRRFASEEGRAAVERVVMVLERRPLRPRTFGPPALVKLETPQPVAPTASGALPASRRLLELGLAGLAIMGFSVGLGAFIAIHNLPAILAARSAASRPMVASLSPALPAALAVPHASTPSVAAAPVVSHPPPSAARALAPPPTKAWSRPAASPPAEPPGAAVTTVVPRQTIAAEPTAASTQALFDNAN